MLPEGFTGNNTAADIHVHPSGKFVYASNRGADSIVIYSADPQSGKLTLVGHESTQGKTPRNFSLDPTGSYLLAANQQSDSVVVFSIDAVKQYIRNYVRYCAAHPEHARLMMQEANRDSERLKWMAETFVRPRHDRSVPLVRYVSETTDGLARIDPVVLLYMITAIAQVPYLLTAEMRYAHGIDALDEKAIDAHCDAVVAFIFR